ncbi:hypothetical protein NDN08_008031 [Rhodosorus marinus]|uniref:DNA-3-methyladenine glycosylase I n=1 Tax=Rhodosorus marinus TaxID=101924 RepID=A0AAV8V396_9RHOD|nr:hypothetical protein NDN08_008031 [Rhodosorus marinus]
MRSVTFVSSLLLAHPNNKHIMVSTRSMARPADVRLAASARGASEGKEEPTKKKKPRSPRKKREPEPVVDDGLKRCPWAGYVEVDYHDKEWGRPVYDDVKLFEFITLEGAQAGLSWRTVLLKRDNYRKAFAGFDPSIVAQFGQDKVEELLQDSGLIRQRGKIESTITNAKLVLEIKKEHGSLSNYVWSFVDGKPIINRFKSMADVPLASEEAKLMAKEMKKKGFKFFGPTIAYAFMQAVGMVNDHTVDCFCYTECGGKPEHAMAA